MIRLIALISALLFLASCSSIEENELVVVAEGDSGSIVGNAYEVDYVIDGDTVVLKSGESVRLLGVDAPEKGECFTDESTDYLKLLISDSLVTLYADPINSDTDVYGRLLRYIYVNDENLNLRMVRDGYAQFYDRFDLTYTLDFQNAEQEAAEASTPIWETCFTRDLLSDVYISFVYYDGEVLNVESDEYVEITYSGTGTINLKNYYINGSRGDQKYTFGDLTLNTGESVKVYTNMGEYSFSYNEAIWNNSGETVYLYSDDGTLADAYSY
jgi:endonuclease YncB( thermonuclease family)